MWQGQPGQFLLQPLTQRMRTAKNRPYVRLFFIPGRHCHQALKLQTRKLINRLYNRTQFLTLGCIFLPIISIEAGFRGVSRKIDFKQQGQVPIEFE